MKFNFDLTVYDVNESTTIGSVKAEIDKGNYSLNNLQPRQGDVMIDVGAHVGMVSMLYAKMYPQLVIHAFEPVVETFGCMCRNLHNNRIKNVIPHNLAITADGRDIVMTGLINKNSGGMTACGTDKTTCRHVAQSVTIRQACSMLRIRDVLVLKMDCEGMEHEIWHGDPDWFRIVSFYLAEHHINDVLRGQGYSFERLRKTISDAKPQLCGKISEIEMCA